MSRKERERSCARGRFDSRCRIRVRDSPRCAVRPDGDSMEKSFLSQVKIVAELNIKRDRASVGTASADVLGRQDCRLLGRVAGRVEHRCVMGRRCKHLDLVIVVAAVRKSDIVMETAHQQPVRAEPPRMAERNSVLTALRVHAAYQFRLAGVGSAPVADQLQPQPGRHRPTAVGEILRMNQGEQPPVISIGRIARVGLAVRVIGAQIQRSGAAQIETFVGIKLLDPGHDPREHSTRCPAYFAF